MLNKRIRMLSILFISIFIIAGCGRTTGETPQGTTQEGGSTEFHIVTSFYPVYIAAINVAKDIQGVSVTNMTKPQTGCLHDYALRPEDLKTLEKADAFVINGAGMEAFLEDVIKQSKDLKIIEASRNIPLLEDESGEENAHVWVSVTNAVTYVENIAEDLAAIDTAHAEQYRANAAAYVEKLEALKKDMHGALDGLKNRDIVTFHEAFPYFAQEFSLNIAAVVEREPGTEPAPKELESIIDMVKQSGIKALFAEPQYSSKAADTIARETGAKVYTLDPVVTGEAGPDALNAYIDVMQQNKSTLLEALQ